MEEEEGCHLKAQLGSAGAPGSEHIVVRVQAARGGLGHGAAPPSGGGADAGASEGGTDRGLAALHTHTYTHTHTWIVT